MKKSGVQMFPLLKMVHLAMFFIMRDFREDQEEFFKTTNFSVPPL